MHLTNNTPWSPRATCCTCSTVLAAQICCSVGVTPSCINHFPTRRADLACLPSRAGMRRQRSKPNWRRVAHAEIRPAVGGGSTARSLLAHLLLTSRYSFLLLARSQLLGALHLKLLMQLRGQGAWCPHTDDSTMIRVE